MSIDSMPIAHKAAVAKCARLATCRPCAPRPRGTQSAAATWHHTTCASTTRARCARNQQQKPPRHAGASTYARACIPCARMRRCVIYLTNEQYAEAIRYEEELMNGCESHAVFAAVPPHNLGF